MLKKQKLHKGLALPEADMIWLPAVFLTFFLNTLDRYPTGVYTMTVA